MGDVRPDDEDRRPWWIPRWVRPPERPQSAEGWAIWTLVALVAAWLLHRAWRWSVDHWPWALLVLAALAFAVDRYWRSLWQAELRRRDRVAAYSLTWDEITAMHWREFELAVMRLMRRDGIDAVHTGKAGDFSVDVTGDDPALGERWAVQVKHYSPTTRSAPRTRSNWQEPPSPSTGHGSNSSSPPPGTPATPASSPTGPASTSSAAKSSSAGPAKASTSTTSWASPPTRTPAEPHERRTTDPTGPAPDTGMRPTAFTM